MIILERIRGTKVYQYFVHNTYLYYSVKLYHGGSKSIKLCCPKLLTPWWSPWAWRVSTWHRTTVPHGSFISKHMWHIYIYIFIYLVYILCDSISWKPHLEPVFVELYRLNILTAILLNFICFPDSCVEGIEAFGNKFAGDHSTPFWVSSGVHHQ